MTTDMELLGSELVMQSDIAGLTNNLLTFEARVNNGK
jgi:hypothetical protein